MTTTLYPTGYSTQLLSLPDLIHRHMAGAEPETVLRVTALLLDHNGHLGIGSGWRPCPSDTSPASARCASFHQTQAFNDGTRWFCAFDFVYLNLLSTPSNLKPHIAPPLGIIPVQGSIGAGLPPGPGKGIHANVGTPGKPGFESWHGQPSEFDGFDTWVRDGRDRPLPIMTAYLNNPIPTPPTYDLRTTAMLDTLHTIAPTRFFDTRGFGTSVPAGEYAVSPPYPAVDVQTGRPLLSSTPDSDGLTTVILGVKVNVKIVDPTQAGFATIYTTAGATPSTSIIDFQGGPGDALPAYNAMVDIPVTALGDFQVFINVPAGIVVDLYGYWS